MDVQQIKLRAMALIGRYKPKVIRTTNAKLAFWIARRRQRNAFLLAASWPLWVVAAVLAWPLFMAPPAEVRPWLHYTNVVVRVCFVLVALVTLLRSKARRWERFAAR